ncbi:hypothetical protein Tco_0324639 [Tanacetum coccineum]
MEDLPSYIVETCQEQCIAQKVIDDKPMSSKGSKIDSMKEIGTTGGGTSSVLPLLVGCIVSFVTSVSRSITLGEEEVIGIEHGSDRRELDKQEVEQPEVDRFDLDEPGVGKLELD